MGEPAAISFSDVLKGHKNDRAAAEAAWRKIGEVTKAGDVYPGELAAIDLTNSSDSIRDRVGKLSSAEEEVKKETTANTSPTNPPAGQGTSQPGTGTTGGGNS